MNNYDKMLQDDLTELIRKLKETRPNIYRHLIGLIKAILARA